MFGSIGVAGMASFSNLGIRTIRWNKPHLILKQGYWRVSPMPHHLSVDGTRWGKAHVHARKLNEARQFGMVVPGTT